MTQRVCLRCDWAGETRATECPECGAGLFAPAGADRSAEPSRRGLSLRRRRSSPTEPSQAPPPIEPEDEPQGTGATATPERSTLHRVGTAALIVVAVSAIVLVQVNSRDPNAPTGRIGVRGILVYADRDVSRDVARIWLWNLETGGVSEGPEVATPTALVDASLAGPGWIGLTSTLDGETVRASYLEALGASEREVPITQGYRIAWEPFGAHIARLSKDGSGLCEIATIALVEGTEAATPPFACDRVGALARSSAQTLAGVTEGSATDVRSVFGTQESTVLAHDAQLVGVSETGRVLVVPTECSIEDQMDGLCPGLSLLEFGERGIFGEDDPPVRLVRYGERDAALRFDVLAGWSRVGDRAFVVGTYRGVVGLYEVPVPRPSVDVRHMIEPTRLLPVSTRDVHVTEAQSGELLVNRGGTLILLRGSRPPEFLEPPDGAPTPWGPILWVPTATGDLP